MLQILFSSKEKKIIRNIGLLITGFSILVFTPLDFFHLIIPIFFHPQMWKSVVGHDVSVSVETQGDDWDTDPDFVVSVEITWTIKGRGQARGLLCTL